MASALMGTAYSPNMKSSLDLATGLCDAEVEPIAQSLTLPCLGAIPNAVAAVRRATCPHREGDVFLLNDPYDGGTHLPDLSSWRPLLGGAPVGTITVLPHGSLGRVAGAMPPTRRRSTREGCASRRSSWWTPGHPGKGLALIERNGKCVDGAGRPTGQSCLRHRGAGDGGLLRRRYGGGAGSVAGRRGGSSAGQGPASFKAETDALVAYAERFARPPGGSSPPAPTVSRTPWTGTDDPGVRLRVALTLGGGPGRGVAGALAGGAGGRLQEGALSVGPSTAPALHPLGGLRLRALPAGARLPNNWGYFGPSTSWPHRGRSSTLPPAPVAACASTVSDRQHRLRRPGPGAPERVPACESGGDTGISPGWLRSRRRPFVYLEFLHGSWGKRKDRSTPPPAWWSTSPTPPSSWWRPATPCAWSSTASSRTPGAPGRSGGLGTVKELHFLEAEGTLQVRADRQRFRPAGLVGGNPAPRGPTTSQAFGGSCVGAPAGQDAARRAPGDRFRHILPGAGGWGPPQRRPGPRAGGPAPGEDHPSTPGRRTASLCERTAPGVGGGRAGDGAPPPTRRRFPG